MGTALVTGASAGLGLEFAWQLATARHDVVLVARDAERLERLAGQLNAAAGVRAEVLPADLSRREDVERVADRLRQDERPVGLLVNNAGYSTGDSFVGSDLAFHEQALDVMVRAVLVLSHAAASAMTERGRGAILNVSSVAALTTAGPYSAHKAWVRVFTEGLAVELRGTGVTATALCPGLTHTEFHERAGVDRSRFPELAWLNADDVVAAALADVRRGAVISTPSLRYGVISEVARLLPRAAIRRLSDLSGAATLAEESY
ncbi:SDR family NAD(P)-dependent oxidoreductase [Isoptericola sp. b441]|uniref:SDR family NAD(P)-dependent oxidoreductase n=1 Tax=Actinotalea lenta TaxID=3064654 RepID=A0ABT9D5A8_9CELL|nr:MULTISPECIES: SDR family NAD(P)-dependent oxidoreductase [unclassified Isoptericola]MDO8105933.1 SDR family NAD(P)-dependent oxidoreductase [Isoptericola sp. b441]MDO8122648.1 SDR family NAD(P)-dependent oxidoreductase [Isoptericola sp. b490]